MGLSSKRKRRVRRGKPLYVCDQSGFVYSQDQMVRQWDGLLVGKEHEDPRHPQEFVRGVVDDYAVRNARPRNDANDLLASTSLSGFVSSPSTFVFDRSLELVRDRSGNVVKLRGDINRVGELVNVDLGQIEDVAWVTIQFDALTLTGREGLNLYSSEDGVEYTPMDILVQERFKNLTVGEERNYMVGRRARYIRLGFTATEPTAISFTISKFEVYGS